MTPEIKELLPLYALGILDPDEERTVETAMASDPSIAIEIAIELAAYRDASSELIAPVAPPAAVKTRLMASIGDGRFEAFSGRMSKLFEVSVDKAREILGLTDRPGSWDAVMPGIGLVHFDGGSSYAAADCGIIRLAEGTMFPPHTHRGEEVSLILVGQVLASENGVERILSPGDELVQAEGSSHHLVAIGGECIFAARAMNGIEIGGAPARPPKPDR